MALDRIGARPQLTGCLDTLRLANMCENGLLHLMLRSTTDQHHLFLLHTLPSSTHFGHSFIPVGHASITSVGVVTPSTFVRLVFILAALYLSLVLLLLDDLHPARSPTQLSCQFWLQGLK